MGRRIGRFQLIRQSDQGVRRRFGLQLPEQDREALVEGLVERKSSGRRVRHLLESPGRV